MNDERKSRRKLLSIESICVRTQTTDDVARRSSPLRTRGDLRAVASNAHNVDDRFGRTAPHALRDLTPANDKMHIRTLRHM